MNNLTRKQQLLLEFVKTQHGKQVRKYTGEPYWTHPLAVAHILINEGLFNLVDAALCHDLYEDTKCTFDSLYKELIKLDYNAKIAYKICTQVKELTDVFTHEDYPYMNRAKRKKSEAKRLGTISSGAQTIKYADLIDNTESITEHDAEFSKVYLKEKLDMLIEMTEGECGLYQQCCKRIK